MSVSSLQKKMFTGRMLVLVFLVGLLSLTFLVIKVSNVFAATAAPVAPTSTLTGVSTTAQSISFSWTAPANFSGSKWVVASSTNRVPTDAQIAVITDTSTLTFTVNGLATNTAYYLGAAGGDAAGATSSYATSSQTYTLAVTPGTPTVNTAAVQGFLVTINSSSNPAATTFIVRDTAGATLQYLQEGGTWGTSSGTTFTAVQLGAINGTTSIQLATNSLHRISVAAVNGNTITTSFSSAVDIITLADTPGTPTLSATGTTFFTVTINSSTNPATTTFIIRDAGGTTPQYLQSDGTWGTSSSSRFTAVQLGAINGTSTTGLTANTTHTISVAAVNGSGVTTSFGTALASFHTHANIPSSVSLASNANSFTLTWSGDATEYYAEDVTAGTNSGWITATNFSVLNVNCGTTRTFRVKGRNADNVETSVSTSTEGTTNACGGSGSGGGSGGTPATPFSSATPATPAKPAVPGVSPAVPATPATPASVSLPSTASPVAVFIHTLGTGSKGEEVRQLQQKLRELGFFKHPTNTGLFGPATKAAVVAFQKAQGFRTAPGVVGPATRDALNSESGVSAGETTATPAPAPSPTLGQFVSNLRLGSRGEEVRMLQAKLRELGYFTYPTDTGSFGPATRAALREFQKDQGLSQVGFVGPGTRAALNSL